MIFYFIIEEPLFANLQKKFHTLNVNIYFIQKLENILNTETTTIAISSH